MLMIDDDDDDDDDYSSLSISFFQQIIVRSNKNDEWFYYESYYQYDVLVLVLALVTAMAQKEVIAHKLRYVFDTDNNIISEITINGTIRHE